MERKSLENDSSLQNLSLSQLRGEYVAGLHEVGHNINYYLAEVPEGEEITLPLCAGCGVRKVVVIRHETDHNGDPYFLGLCEEDVPPFVKEVLESGKNE